MTKIERFKKIADVIRNNVIVGTVGFFASMIDIWFDELYEFSRLDKSVYKEQLAMIAYYAFEVASFVKYPSQMIDVRYPEIVKIAVETYKKKNAAYGNSFSNAFRF